MVKKRISIIVLSILCLAGIPNYAVAANSTFAAAYEWEDTLYIAASIPDMTVGRCQLQTGNENGRIQGDSVARRQSDSDATLNLMLLVDCSTSMPDYKSRTMGVVESLLAGVEKYSVTVASFGRKFEVKKQHLTDWASINRELNKLKQTEQGTDICGGIAQAIQEMKASEWSPGSFSHILVITDGEPYYVNQENAELEASRERDAATLLVSQMENSPQVFLHSISFQPWGGVDETFQAVTSFGGVHRVAQSDKLAETYGRNVAESITNLSLIEFSMPSKYFTEDLRLIVSSSFTEMNPDRAVVITRSANLNNHEESPIDSSSLPIISGRESTSIQLPDSPEGQPSSNDAVSNPPEKLPIPNLMTPTNQQDDEQRDTDESIPSASDRSEEESTSDTNEPENQSETESNATPPETDTETRNTGSSEILILPSDGYVDKKTVDDDNQSWIFTIFMIVLGTVVAIAGFAVAFMLLKKKQEGIPIHVIISGSDAFSGEKRTLYLKKQLLVGSDKRCDLIINHSSVASVNTRLYTENQEIYIEDLNSPSGTSIEGMRIFSPTILHSGEEVLIGDISVKFDVQQAL